MKQTIEKVIKVLIYLSFFVPLVTLPQSFIFPFIVPKILLFRSLVMLMLGGYVLLLMINWDQYRPRFNWLNIAVLLFWLSLVISTFVGVDWYHSFWDNHERMLGLFTITHYFLFFFICSNIFKDWDEWRTALRVFLIAGSAAMLVGIMQVYNPELLLNQGNARVASTLGNSIYVGGYGMFLFFMSALLVSSEKKKDTWFYVEIAMGILALLGLFFSGTRGAILGLIAGFGTGLIGYIIVIKKRSIRVLLASILFILIVSIFGMYNARETEFVKNIPAVGRAVNTSWSDVKSSARWIAWEIGYEAWNEKKVFGYGPNNYFYIFNQKYNPRSLSFGYGETWFDNAHNIIINTLAVQGMFGLVTYLFIFLTALLMIWRAYFKDDLNKHLAVGTSAFLGAHFIANITVFENPTSYLYYTFLLALIVGMTTIRKKSGEDDKIVPNKTIGMTSVGVSGIIFVLLIFLFNVQPARANTKTLTIIRLLNSKPSLAIEPIKEILSFSSPHIDDIRADVSRSVAAGINNIYKSAGPNLTKELLEISTDALKKNVELHPYDIRNQLTLSQLAQIHALLVNDKSYYDEAEAFLNDALSKSPERQQILFALGSLYEQTRQYEKASGVYLKTINLNSHISEGYYRLIYLYNKLGLQKETLKVIQTAKSYNVDFAINEKQLIDKIIASSTITSTIK